MKISVFLLFVFSVIIFSSCNNNNKKNNNNNTDFDRIYGTTLKYPQNLENVVDSTENTEVFFTKPVKIVSNVFFGCGDCIGTLQKLNDFVESFHSDKIALIVYGNTDKSYTGIYSFLSIVPDFKYPIFADTSKLFITKNNLPEFNLAYHTLLVDKNDSVRVIGSTVDN